MRTLAVFGLLFLLAGCASGSGGGETDEPQADRPQTDRYVLTATELAQYPTSSAREAIQRLRRFWLASGTRVLLKGKRIAEPIDFLDRYRVDQVVEMRFYDLTRARVAFGPEFTTPIIELTLRE